MERNVSMQGETVVNDVYTAYNGICKGFQIKGEYEAKVKPGIRNNKFNNRMQYATGILQTTAVFSLPPGNGGETVFILRHPWESALLAYQVRIKRT